MGVPICSHATIFTPVSKFANRAVHCILIDMLTGIQEGDKFLQGECYLVNHLYNSSAVICSNFEEITKIPFFVINVLGFISQIILNRSL